MRLTLLVVLVSFALLSAGKKHQKEGGRGRGWGRGGNPEHIPPGLSRKTTTTPPGSGGDETTTASGSSGDETTTASGSSGDETTTASGSSGDETTTSSGSSGDETTTPVRQRRVKIMEKFGRPHLRVGFELAA